MVMQRVYDVAVTTPHGTTPGAPLKTALALEDQYLTSIEIEIPPGHAGTTGIRITRAGTQIIPFTLGSWIIADNRDFVIPVNAEITVTGVVIETYNQGAYDHVHYVRATVIDTPVTPPAVASIVATIPNSVLTS